MEKKMVDDDNTQQDLDNIKASVDGYMGDVPPAPEAPRMQAAARVVTEDISEPAPTTITNDSEEAPVTTQGYGPQVGSFGQQEMSYPNAPGSIDIEKIHEIVEGVVSERWEEMMAKTGNLPAWKEKVNMNIVAMKQELVRLSTRIEAIQGAVMGKVKDYDQSMRNVHSEMKALEKVFERILDPLVSNIKQLERVAKDIKEGIK